MRVQGLPFTNWWIKSNNNKGMRLIRLLKTQDNPVSFYKDQYWTRNTRIHQSVHQIVIQQ